VHKEKGTKAFFKKERYFFNPLQISKKRKRIMMSFLGNDCLKRTFLFQDEGVLHLQYIQRRMKSAFFIVF